MGKKGKIVTTAALAALTVALAAVILVNLGGFPTQSSMVIITEDYGGFLEGSWNIQEAILDSAMTGYGMMLEGTISPQEYAGIAETASDQTTSQIMSLVTADAPAQWAESYAQSMESLRALNSMLRETIVHAGSIERGENPGDTPQRIKELQEMIQEHLANAQAARP